MDVQNELRRRTRRRRLLAVRRYRSRLFWRTISRRRRVIGLAVLAVLLALAAAVAFFLRTGRIERLAEAYLADLTGHKIGIHEARFSPFEGIRLRKLKVWPAGDETGLDEDAIFTADEVLLATEPGSLLTGKLKVTRIVAVRPEIRKIETPGRPPSYTRQNRPDEQVRIKLPPIELREGRYVTITRLPRQKPIITYEMALTAELRPDPATPDLYHISGRGGQRQLELIPVSGKVWLNPFRCETNVVVVKSLQQLPEQVEQVLKKYDINIARVKTRGGFNSATGQLVVHFDCQGTQMTLSAAELLGWGAPDAAAAGAAKATTRPADLPLRLTEVYGPITVRVLDTSPPPGEKLPPGQIVFGAVDDDAAYPGSAVAAGLRHCWRFFAGGPQPLRGKLNGQPFALAGRYDGFTLDAAFQVAADIRGVPIPADEPFLECLPKWVRDLRQEYSPAGVVDIELRAGRAQRGGAVDVEGCVRLVDCSANYERFPYRCEQVNGTVRFDGRQVALDLTGRRGSATVEVRGTAGLKRHWPLDIEVVGRNVPVDAQLLAALRKDRPATVAALERLKIGGGRIDFHCRVRRKDDPDDWARPAITIGRIDGVDLEPGYFRYPVRILAGQAQPSDDGVKLTNLQAMPRHLIRPAPPGGPATRPAFDSAAILMVDGFVGYRHPDDPDIELELAASSLPLDETLWRALPESVAREVLRYHVDAHAGLFGVISKKTGQPIRFDITGQLNGGFVKADDFPYALDSLDGRVRVTPDWIELDRVVGMHNGVPVRANGRIGLAATQPTDLAFRCDRLPLDGDLKAALSPSARKTWEQLAPSGVVAVDARLTQPAATQPAEEPARADAGSTARRPPATPPDDRPPLATVVTVTALGNGLCYSEFPYPLHNVTGQMVIRPDRVDIVEMTDRAAGRTVHMSGTLWPTRDNLNLPPGQSPLPMADLSIVAMNVTFDEALRRAVPWQIRKVWNDVLPAGQFDLRLEHLRNTPLGAASRWDYSGRLDLRDARGTFGVALDGLTGQLVGAGAIIPGRAAAFVGSFEKVAGTVAGRPVSDLSGQVLLDARGRLRVEKLSARVHGGAVDGFAEVAVNDPDLTYRLALNGRDIDLDQLVNHGRTQAQRWKLTGRLEGRIALEGKANTGARRGRGDIVLTRAEIYQVPTVLPMFPNPDRKTRNPNQAAEIIFYLDGNRLTFEQAILRDPALSLMGTGMVDLADGTVDLTFVAGQPAGNQRPGGVKLLEELISGAGEELMQYHLSGPLNKPVVQAVSLHTLRDAIEELTKARKRYQKPAGPAPRPPASVDTAPLPGIQPSTPGGR